jgi:hypothetical protein
MRTHNVCVIVVFAVLVATQQEAEFDRLDKNKNGELDPKELTQSKLRASPSTAVGK